VKDKDIDDALRGAGLPPKVDSAVVDRLADSVAASLRPVRPLPPAWLLEARLCAICAIIAVAGASMLGLNGLHRLSGPEVALIFPVLGIFMWIAAMVSVRQTTPGSRGGLSPGLLLVAECLALFVTFALLFHDYATDSFVSGGFPCLKAGLLHAIPAGLLSWFILRRGFAVNAPLAG
jgi:hypothetical protein